MACDEIQIINLFVNFTDSDSLVNKFGNIVSHKPKSDEIEYNCHVHVNQQNQKGKRSHKSISLAHKRS